MNKWNVLSFVGAIFVGGILIIGVKGLFFSQIEYPALAEPHYMQIAKKVHQSFEADSNYFNCWDFSNALVKELEANGYNAFVKKGLKCNSYCWRPDYNSSLCCERHAWVAIETDNGLIELEATTGRIIWK